MAFTTFLEISETATIGISKASCNTQLTFTDVTCRIESSNFIFVGGPTAGHNKFWQELVLL